MGKEAPTHLADGLPVMPASGPGGEVGAPGSVRPRGVRLIEGVSRIRIVQSVDTLDEFNSRDLHGRHVREKPGVKGCFVRYFPTTGISGPALVDRFGADPTVEYGWEQPCPK
jgi:hypothetical protein